MGRLKSNSGRIFVVFQKYRFKPTSVDLGCGDGDCLRMRGEDSESCSVVDILVSVVTDGSTFVLGVKY
jgi:hypothetical protein